LKPTTSVCIQIENKTFEENASGDGQYDAFWNALHKVFKGQKIDLPKLIDYAVRIPPGSDSDALCETTIVWRKKQERICYSWFGFRPNCFSHKSN
jgi:D-citramalate synthase